MKKLLFMYLRMAVRRTVWRTALGEWRKSFIQTIKVFLWRSFIVLSAIAAVFAIFGLNALLSDSSISLHWLLSPFAHWEHLRPLIWPVVPIFSAYSALVVYLLFTPLLWFAKIWR